MYKIYFKQAWHLLRENPLLSVISVCGTALAICMVMVIIIAWQVRTMNYAPESHRDRMLYITAAVATKKDDAGINNGGRLGSHTVRELFSSLEEAEAVGMALNGGMNELASLADHSVELKCEVSYTDAGYWQVFDFRFLAGKPFGEAAVRSGLHEAVITESVARRLYGTTDVVGKPIELGYVPYTIRGVVRDISRLATAAYSDIWVPYTLFNPSYDNWSERLLGPYSVYILARSSADFPRIREEVGRRVERLNASLRDYRLRLGGAPDTPLMHLNRGDAFTEPDVTGAVLRYLLIGAVILLVPAINMSGLTLSRMRKRMSEIGVRRAFGATRGRLVGQILYENLLQTLLGGLLGLVLSYVAVVSLSEWLLSASGDGLSSVFLRADMLFSPTIFLLAFLACLLLNLLSAGVPAWRGSRAPIVEALSEY